MQEHLAYIIGQLKPLGAKHVLVQVPNGLRTRAIELVQGLEKAGYTATLAADECFGACDLPLEVARSANVDAILHIGHVPFYKAIKTDVPVVYYEWPLDVALDEAKLAKEISKMKEGKIGLVSSVQYMHILPKVAEIIKSAGKAAIVGGYVFGCWTKNAEAVAPKSDVLLFVGSGMFHPRGFHCDYFLDLERSDISDVRADITKWEKVRWGRISQAKNAIKFAILVSTKPGQFDMERAKHVKALLESKDKKAFVLILSSITDSTLLGLDIDAFINTACPRLADDRWSKPFINAADVEKLFEE